MHCPVCYSTISSKRKKQIKHLHTHSSEELALTVLHLDRQITIYRSADAFRQEQPATLALDDPAALFSLIAPAPAASEENSEGGADFDPGAAGMEQCAHCGLWVWPGDMAYHLDITCPEIQSGEPAPAAQPAPAVEERGDYATVEYIRIPVDGAEFMLLNALALYIHRTNGNG